jgi:PAS domain S-box-containing protein
VSDPDVVEPMSPSPTDPAAVLDDACHGVVRSAVRGAWGRSAGHGSGGTDVAAGTALDDQRRDRSLAALGLLDGDQDPAFGSLVQLAADACEADRAGLTLVASDRAWLAAGVRTTDPEVPRTTSMCARVVATEQPVAAGDLIGEGSVEAHRCVLDHGQDAYLGAPVRDPDGLVVGTVWVTWAGAQDVPQRLVRVVEGLAEQATNRLAQRRRELELEALTERRQRELREEAAARRVLRELANGRSESTVLESFVRELEDLLPGTRCSIMLLDGDRLRVGAAPSLPSAFVAAADGLPVGPDVGSCGAAAATGRTAVAVDLRVDPRWAGARDVAEAAGLRSCWSVPIAADADRVVLGTFAVYRDRPAAPRHEELATVDRFTELAAIAIEHGSRQREIERRARILDQVGDAVLVCDPSRLRVRRANGAAATLTGVRVADLPGRSLERLVTSQDNQRLHAMVGALSHGTATDRTLEVSVVRPDGRRPRTELRAQLIEGELVVVARDLSDREAFDAALRRSEGRFRDLAERSNEGIYRLQLRPEVRYQYVNESFAALCDATPDELLADPSLPLARVHPGDREVLLEGRDPDRRPDLDLQPRDVRILRTDGSVTSVLLSELPIRDDDGRVVALQGIAVDVTERQRTQSALRAALDQERRTAERLRQVDALKDSFLQAVSHELRTPLTAILGFAQTLRDHDGQLGHERRAMLLHRLTRNADRLGTLLRDLLDLDRLSAGHGLAERRQTDLGELLRRVADDVDLGDRELIVVPDRCAVPVDGPKVERVLVNLLENAAKHTPPGTRVVAEVRSSTAGCELVVSDDGPGIDSDLRRDVFQAFRQGPASATDPSPGTGIGLALVARVAELHGGEAWVEPSDAGGAAFHVRLPAQPDQPGAGSDVLTSASLGLPRSPLG